MRRFRFLRGRSALVALLPLAAVILGTTITEGPISTAQAATDRQRIEPVRSAVRFGNRLIVRGQFEGASNAPVEIQLRPKGRRGWRTIRRARTGGAGAYRAAVKPLTSGRWRAVLMPGGAGTSNVRTLRRSKAPLVRVRSKANAWTARRHLRTGTRTRVKGRVRPGGRRRVVVRGAGRSKRTRTRPDGRFSVRWPAGSGTGRYRIRVLARANHRSTASRAGAGRVTVYRPASASYYGPGFYGNRTACGQTMTTSTQGVAHKSLPCGTKLRLRHRGRSATVRVIDRGPYAAGRELDLTYATKRRLGFGSTGTVMMSK